MYGFAKNSKANLSDDELEVYRRPVAAFLKADAAVLQRLVDADELKVAKKALKYRSDALAVAHKTAADLHRAGVIDKGTMREFDASCLMTVEDLSPSSATLRMNSAFAAAAEMNSSSQTVDEPSPSMTSRVHSESSSHRFERPLLCYLREGTAQRRRDDAWVGHASCSS